MNTEAKKLISRANTLVRPVLDSRNWRRGYPPEVKSIIRSLIVKHKLTISRVASLVPVSRAYILECHTKKKRTKSSPAQNTTFKQISVKSPTGEMLDWRTFIMAALALVTISQALVLVHLLFLY